MNVQQMDKVSYAQRAYTEDPATLALMLAIAIADVAKSINWYHNPRFSPGRATFTHPLRIEAGLKECIVIICAIANVLRIDLGLSREEQL